MINYPENDCHREYERYITQFILIDYQKLDRISDSNPNSIFHAPIVSFFSGFSTKNFARNSFFWEILKTIEASILCSSFES